MRTTAGRIVLTAAIVVGTLMGTAFGAHATDGDDGCVDSSGVLGLCLPPDPEFFDELFE